MVNLGDRVQDIISGIKGLVVAKTQWLYGCERITIDPEGNDKGKQFERITVDEPQVKVLKSRVIKLNKAQIVSSPAGDRGDESSVTRS